MSKLRARLIQNLRDANVKATIHEAESVKIAREIIGSQPIKLVICDWNLPDGTGFDFLCEVKKNTKLRKIPFIMCTTQDEISNILSAISEGAEEFIVKPWSEEELEEKFFSVWSKHYS